MSSAKRVTITFTFTLGVMLFGAVAWACVPQEGKGTVMNVEAPADSNGSGTQTDIVVGDGVPTTAHSQSWCEDHPSAAVYAEPNDELEFNISPAAPGQSDTPGCPASGNGSSLSNGQVHVVEGNAYTWNGDYWDFRVGDRNGCYADTENPVAIGSISLNSNGASIDGQDTETVGSHPDNDSTNATSDGALPRTQNDIGDQASLLCVGDPLSDSNPTALFFPMVMLNSDGTTATI